MLDRLRTLWVLEPVRVTGYVAALVVFVCLKAGVVVDEQSVLAALALILPLILSTEKARSKVSPEPDFTDDELAGRTASKHHKDTPNDAAVTTTILDHNNAA